MTWNKRCKKCNSAPHHCECQRKYIEKCPHRNPQGQCPQCNLAQSFGYPSTSQEKNHSEILSKVRKILVVDPSSQAENSTIVEQPVNEDAVPFKIIQEEKPDWPSRVLGIAFLLAIVVFAGFCYVQGRKIFFKK